MHVSAHHAAARPRRRAQPRRVNLGGELVRIAPTVRFAGPGGDADLLGVYFAGDGQHFESRLLRRPRACRTARPTCCTRTRCRDPDRAPDAHTVWIGDVLIRPEATGTDTYEMNRNLLLTDGARADSVPNLEIETGKIAGAGHASATGRFDDLQLFYLLSRGIPDDEARRLVVRGFFADIVAKIGVPAVREPHHDRHRGPSWRSLTESRASRRLHDHPGNPRPARQRRPPRGRATPRSSRAST